MIIRRTIELRAEIEALKAERDEAREAMLTDREGYTEKVCGACGCPVSGMTEWDACPPCAYLAKHKGAGDAK